MCAITVLDGLLRSCTWKRSLKMGLPPELVRFAWSGERSGGKSRIVWDLRHTLAKVDAYRYLQRSVRICPVLSWLGGTGTRLSLSSSRSRDRIPDFRNSPSEVCRVEPSKSRLARNFSFTCRLLMSPNQLFSVMARRAAPHCTGPSSSFESLLLSFGRSPIASHTVDLGCPSIMVPGLTSTSARTPTMMTLCLAWGIP